MKRILVLVAVLTTALGAPQPLSLPRLPVGLMLKHNGYLKDSRIVGGVVTDPYEFPFVVSVQRQGSLVWSHVCGGSVYNERWIITSATCVDGLTDVSSLRVDAAEWSFSETSGDEQLKGVVGFIIHEDFDSGSLQNDIALIQLNNVLDFGRGTVLPISLPSQGDETDDGANVAIAGWGDSVYGGLTSDKLRKVSVNVLNNEDCDAAFGGGLMTATNLCAWTPAGGQGPCSGDAGGPLFTSTKPYTLVGIASWSYRCAIAGYPAVYTRASSYVNWIADNVRP